MKPVKPVKQIALKITALSPLSIRADHSPTGADVAPYVPGSTLMGSLASAHRLLRRDEAEFTTFFLSDLVQYPNLYPASFKNAGMQNAFSPVYCIPRTSQTCKRFKGFHPLPEDDLDEEEQGHGVRDSLLDWAVFTLAHTPERVASDAALQPVIKPLEQHKVCPTCDAPLDSFNGFYRWGEDEKRAVTISKTRLLTRTGINRRFGTVEEEILYNREVYEEQMCFFGVIRASEEVADTLQKFLWQQGRNEDSPLLLNDFARLGTGRTRGLGQVAFELLADEGDEDRYTAFKARLHQFDADLRQSAAHFEVQPTHPLYIALTLHAPTLLYDELLRHAGIISGEQLATLTGQSADTFTLLYHSAETRRVMGWQELWGLPRMQEYALDAGSVFLFAVTRPLDETLAQVLFTLEEQGIGQRRAEGFGRFCFSDPFHRTGDLQ